MFFDTQHCFMEKTPPIFPALFKIHPDSTPRLKIHMYESLQHQLTRRHPIYQKRSKVTHLMTSHLHGLHHRKHERRLQKRSCPGQVDPIRHAVHCMRQAHLPQSQCW